MAASSSGMSWKEKVWCQMSYLRQRGSGVCWRWKEKSMGLSECLTQCWKRGQHKYILFTIVNNTKKSRLFLTAYESLQLLHTMYYPTPMQLSVLDTKFFRQDISKFPCKTGKDMRFAGKGYFWYPSLFFGQSDSSIRISLPVTIVTVPPSVLC